MHRDLKGSRISGICLSTFLILQLPQIAVALEDHYECPSVTPDPAMDPEYRRLNDPVRCEGYFTRNVSQKFVELISLTLGKGIQSEDTSTELSLSAPFLAMAKSKAAILVQPLGARPLYRVDLPLTSADLQWKADQMLRRTGLQLRRLGFLALLETPETSVLAVTPVALSEDARNSSVATAKVRVSLTVKTMKYRVVPVTGSAPGSGWQEVPEVPLYAWDSADIQVNLLPASGRQRVEVQATDEDGKKLPLLRFIVVGPSGN